MLVDITKDAQQGTAIFDFDAAKPRPYRPHPMLRVEDTGLAQAAELIRNAKRPVILAGHGVSESGAMEQVRTLAERAQIPVALTLLGLGAFPASHPLNLGMMGMHGEAWVNHAIQEADLLIACGMRFDDRVTGTTRTYALKAKKIHIEVDPAEINKNIKVDVALVGDLREVLEAAAAAHSPAATAPRGSRPSNPARAQRPCATSRTCPTPATSTPPTSCTTSGASPAATPLWSPT